MPNLVTAERIAPQAGGFEPQRQANWTLEIADPSIDVNDVIQFSLESGFLPSRSNEEIELHFGNERRYVAGKALYEAGTLVVKDFVDARTAKIVSDWQELVYNPATGVVGLASQYKKEANIVLFGPNGTGRRVWTLVGLWPQAVNFGSLDMTANDKVTIEMTMRYDVAIPTTLDTTLSAVPTATVPNT